MKKLYISFLLLFLCLTSYSQLIISSNTTWSTNQTLTQPVIVNLGATLTINPGIIVSVLFIDNNSDQIGDVIIDVKGSLIVNGDACNKVQFKPFQNTTNKQYWTGISLDTISINNSIKGAIISYAKNGVVVENSNIIANGIEINNCKSNGILAFGSSALLNINNCSISNCDGEGAKISNSSNCQLKYLKIRNNGATGLLLNSTTVAINNSVFYNNSKSGIFTLGSTITINNSISRKNNRMGICVNNSTLLGNYLDIDSNSVDGVFIGGASTFNIQNSSIVRNIGFGIETSEYIVNSDFGNIALTNSTPSVSVNNSNFIKNHNTSVVLTTNDIPGMNTSPYGIGYTSSTSGTYCQSLGNNCSSWSEVCNNISSQFNPSPLSAWYNYQTFHVPFGRFENFVGSVSCNPNGGNNPNRYKCAYGVAEGTNLQNPYWQWKPTTTSTNNPYSNCYPMSGGGTVDSDKISFVTKYSGTDNPITGSSITDSKPWSKFYIDYFSFRFGGYEFRSLVNSTSSNNNLTGNFWDTIVPTNVIQSVGAVLNINGFLISEITGSHSSLPNSFIYNNSNYFELAQNNSVFCSGANNFLIAPSGNYSYSWTKDINPINNNNDSLQITNNGIYVVTINGSCVATSFPTSITLSTGNSISISANGPTTFCAGGNVTLTSPSSSGNLWSNGATSQSIIVSNSGNYSLTVLNPQGCSSVSPSILVNVSALPNPPTISSSGNTSFCQNGSVALSSNLSGNLIWSNGATSQSISATTSGAYSAQIISNGCTSVPSNIIQVNVIQNPNSSVSLSGPTIFCQGSSVVLNAVFVSGNSYQWYNNGTLIPNATSNNFTATTNGSYTVFINDGFCSSISSPEYITVNPIPIAPIISSNGNTTFCQGGSINLSSNNSNVLWSNGSTSQTIIVNQSGNYVAQTISNGCMSPPSNQINVVVNSLPQTPIITPSGSTTFCSGNSVLLTTSITSGIFWSTNQTSSTITVNNSGSYTVTYTDINGCTSTSIPISINVISTPSAPIISANGPTTFCSGSNVTLSSNSVNGNTWSNGNTSSTNVITTSGTYFVTLTENGCTSAPSNSINVLVNQTPVSPIISANSATTFCSGNSVVLSSNLPNGNIWSNNQTTQSITVNSTGNYFVQTTSNGCTSSSNTINVTVNPKPSAPNIITSGPTSFCQGSNVTLTTDAPSGVTWTASNGSQYNVATLIVQSNQSSIFATVTLNGCTSLPSQTISTTVLPIQTPSFSQIPAICSGDNLILPTTSNNGISGNWSPQISNTQSKTYTFTANAGQCANTQTMSITVNSLPQVSLATFNNLCDTIALFQLSGGSPIGGTYTGPSVSNNKFSTSVGVGSYPITYTYTNSNGCKSSALKNLNVINCNTSNIEEIDELNYKIYPNPTTESITIESSLELINTDYILFDISGRSLMSGTLIDAKTEINLSNLSSGTYYIRIFNNNLKLIKQ